MTRLKFPTARNGLFLTALAAMLIASAAFAQSSGTDEEFEDFSELALDELLNVKVVSASKIEQDWADSPNAIWVITAEDIHRAGAT